MNISPNTTTANIDGQDTPMEVLAPSAAMAMERAAVDSQVATAHQYPRSLKRFVERATDMVTMDPEIAESCHYLRPVGTEKGSNKMKYAEGPSIRAAEIIFACWGNIRAKADIVEQTERYVRAVGQAWDLESNAAASVPGIETTLYKDGTPMKESQRNLIAKGLAAKVFRDAVFKVVPRALFKKVMDAAKAVASKSIAPLEERRAKAEAWVGTLKIHNAEARVLQALGVKGWVEVGSEELATLTGLRTGLKDGDITYEEAFPEVIPAPGEKAPAPTKAATPPTKKVREIPPKETPPQSKEPPAQAAAAPEPPPAKPEEPKSGTPAPAEPAAAEPPVESFESAAQPPTEAPPAPVQPIEEIEDAIEALADLRESMRRDGVLERQVVSYAKRNKLMRREQADLADLATKKLNEIRMSWPTISQTVKQEPV